MYKLIKAPEFEKWYDEQPLKSKFQIDDRLLRIAERRAFWRSQGSVRRSFRIKMGQWEAGILRLLGSSEYFAAFRRK